MSTSARGGVVLVSGEAGVSEAVRAAARMLLEETPGGLAGLFVEDARLLAAANVPFTREIGRHSGVARAFEPADIERLLRGRARAFESEGAALAHALRRPWRFEQCRGDALAQALHALEESATVILAPPAASPNRRPDQACVSVIVRAQDAGALRAAERLGKAIGHPLQLHLVEHPHSLRRSALAHWQEAPREPFRSGATHAAMVLISVSVLPASLSERTALLRELQGVLVLVPE